MARDPDAPGYEVDEFDLADPNQKFKDFVTAIDREIDAGRGEDLARNVRRAGGNEAAGLIEGMINVGKNVQLKCMRDADEMANSGDVAGALNAVDEWRADGVLTARQALYVRGSVYEAADDREGELEVIMRTDEMDGEISHSSRASALYRLGRIKEMEELCETWEGSRQDRGEFYLCRARILHADGRPELARRHAVAMLTLEPINWYAIELLGDILADAGDLRGAVLQYNKALSLDYHVMEFHVKKAEALVRMGRPDSAALACRRGLAIWPANVRLLDILERTDGGAEPAAH